jgi:FkbM family methyltransferase
MFGEWISELHPRFWQVMWWMVHRFKFLRPHDPAFAALRHFIAAAPSGLFLDIGANDGISVLSFRKFDSNYRIFSLEPNVLLEPKLKRLKCEDHNFDYLMVGAGSVNVRTIFHVPVYRGVLLHTFVSTDSDQVKGGVRAAFGRFIAERTEIRPVEGHIIRIDELSLQPTIVKIDTEGSDYDILIGMQETIARSRPFIMIEVTWADQSKILSFLDAKDYAVRAYDVSSDTFSSKIEGVRNCFAIPNERLFNSAENNYNSSLNEWRVKP